jgi:hypothetical protein
MTTFKLFKKEINHEFVIDVNESGWTYVDGKLAGTRKVSETKQLVVDFKMGGKKYGGIIVTDEIIKAIEDRNGRLQKKREQEDKEMDADRPAPILDTTDLFVYNLGCDTGLVYPKEYDEVVNSLRRKGIKPTPIYRASRDDKCKFPGNFDSLIPESYIRKEIQSEKTVLVAQGYKHVWCEDQFSFPKQVVEEEKKLLDEARKQRVENKKQLENERKAAIFRTARETGEKQIISEWSEECCDREEECDIDNHHIYALPDGSTEHRWNHTW